MSAFSRINMAEVTRLTRAGKLGQAVTLLLGRSAKDSANGPDAAPATGRPTSRADAERPRPETTIDMEAPTHPGGAWTPPDRASAAASAEDLRETFRRFRQRAAETGSIHGLGNDTRQGAGNAPGMQPGKSAFGTTTVDTGLFDKGFLGRGIFDPEQLDERPAEEAPMDGIRPAKGRGRSKRAPASRPNGGRFEERSFANAAGSRAYKLYVPSGYDGTPIPVVVMLHGCTQNPDDFAAGTGMNDLAEELTFLVVYPAQSQAANMQKCWNWFNAKDQARDAGEPAIIAGITREVIEEFSADPSRVYIAGLSAGGATAAILAATYPDLFAAVGVHSGLACGAARDLPSALAAMNGAGSAQPDGLSQPIPTIVFHGDGDRTVHPSNADRVIVQATPDAALDTVVNQGKSPGGTAYTRTIRSDGTGRALLEQWVLHGVGHAWSGGSPTGSYTDPRGPDASREMLRFFLAHANTRH